jgi:DNA-directed RNA polymerase subunit alpha
VDAAFSPVRRANYRIEPARVGQATDYEKLILEVWTNGTVSPERAVSLAATLLAEHLEIFRAAEEGDVAVGGGSDEETLGVLLDRSIDDFDLSVRSTNCLKNANIHTLRDLVSRSEKEMLETKGLGAKSLEELQALLERFGLSFGMQQPAG